MNFTGGQYDLVAFDPRATGSTVFSCFTDPLAKAQHTFNSGVTSTASDVAEGQLWAAGTVYSNACLETQAKNSSLVNSPFYARDLISVVDALGEDGMLRFWGLSYGTIVAATVSAMFPERIDKMVFDGVQNPHEYYYALGDFEEWTDTDDVFSAIFSTCLDFHENCALSKYNISGAELEKKFWDFLETIKYDPLVLGPATVDYSTLKFITALSLYDASTWPTYTAFLDLLMTRSNDTLAVQTMTENGWLTTKSEGDEAIFQIRCGDRVARAASLEEFKPAIDRLTNTSRVYGDLVVALNAACAQWQVGAAERLDSDFHVKTKNPVLFVGNTWDGHTPLVSAKNVSSTFDGSGLLEIRGYGHGSHVLPSSCSLKAISAYWTDGVLPEPGTVCPVEGVPYSGMTWADVYAEVASNKTAAT
ncbi:Maltose permease MAL61 [Verticillium dahliae VDG1]|nr:Maltose permease MAL61 [Verticillium dahliae VDG1]